MTHAFASTVAADEFLQRIRKDRHASTKRRFVLDACRGARVLDIGCIDHSADAAIAAGDRWLHAEVSHVAASTLGMDYLVRDVEAMQARGFDIVVGDAERFALSERFDVILAADVLEHLANPGQFLERVRAHLDTGGRLVITTPNPFSAGQLAHVLVRGDVAVNEEHVLWMDPVVLFELLRRYGFQIQSFSWLRSDNEAHGGRNLVDRLGDVIFRWRPFLHRNYGVIASVS